LRRHKTLIFGFALHLHAPGSPVNHLPDFQQNCFRVFAPLLIPESPFFHGVAVEEVCQMHTIRDFYKMRLRACRKKRWFCRNQGIDISRLDTRMSGPPQWELQALFAE